ncbi:MAG: ComEC/Rec2 family competence protein [Clostridiales bacterium]|nr:ComEC/Rec2 family competence protein [Clostridiales bacterium]
MKFLKHRHLLQCALAFLLCAFLCYRFPPHIKILFFVTAAFLALVFVGLTFIKVWRRPILQPICLLVSVMLAFGTSYAYHDLYAARIYSLANDSEHRITATIQKINTSLPYASSYDVTINTVDDKKHAFKAELSCDFPTYFEQNDIISLTVVFSEFEPLVNYFPEKQYNLSKGFLLKAEAEEDDAEKIGVSRSVSAYFQTVNQHLSNIFVQNLPDDSAGFVNCVLLGNRTGLSDTVKRDFKNLGLSHLLAISGMHMSVLLGGLYLLLSALSVHKFLKNALVIAAAVCFMFLTGFSPSVTRASLMLILSYLCYYGGLKADPLTSLCTSVALICLVNPNAIYDVGLQLSFSATFGILLTTPIVNANLTAKKVPLLLRSLLNGLFASAAAMTFMLPFMLSSFQSFSLMSLVTTLVFSPILTVILYAAPLFLLFHKIYFLGPVFQFILEKAVAFILFLSGKSAALGSFLISFDFPFVKWIGPAFVILLGLILLWYPKKARWYLVPLSAFVCTFSLCMTVYSDQHQDEITLIASAYKQNDVLSVTQNYHTTVLDITNGSYTAVNQALCCTQRQEYIHAFENYIIINQNNKSVSSLRKMLANYYFKTVYLPSPNEEQEDITRSLVYIAEGAGCDVIFYQYDESFVIHDVTYTIESPATIKRSVKPIHQISINAQNQETVYLGAAFSESEQELPEAAALIAGSYGPLYKQEFSYPGKHVYASQSAAEFYHSDELTVYNDFCRVILNSD